MSRDASSEWASSEWEGEWRTSQHWRRLECQGRAERREGEGEREGEEKEKRQETRDKKGLERGKKEEEEPADRECSPIEKGRINQQIWLEVGPGESCLPFFRYCLFSFFSPMPSGLTLTIVPVTIGSWALTESIFEPVLTRLLTLVLFVPFFSPSFVSLFFLPLSEAS